MANRSAPAHEAMVSHHGSPVCVCNASKICMTMVTGSCRWGNSNTDDAKDGGGGGALSRSVDEDGGADGDGSQG